VAETAQKLDAVVKEFKARWVKALKAQEEK
jgi:hypothetical protein